MIIANVVTFLLVAYVAIQMKGTISHERTKTSERTDTMLKKARYLEDTGEFVEAGTAYDALAKDASGKTRDLAERGTRRVSALSLITSHPLDSAGLENSGLLVSKLQADGGENAIVASLLVSVVSIAKGEPESIQRLADNTSLDEAAPWKDWILGSQYFYAGNAIEACDHLKEVVSLQQKFMPGFLLYGNALSLTGSTSEAVSALETALNLGAGREGYGALGRAHLRAQQWPEAVKNLDRARTLGKPDLVLLKELGFALFQAGSFRASAVSYQDAFALDQNPSTLLMAVLSLRRGRHEMEALALLDAIDETKMPRAIYERGRALAETGRPAEARETLLRYLAAAGGNSAEALRVAEIRKMLNVDEQAGDASPPTQGDSP